MYLVHPCGSIWFYNFLSWTARAVRACGGQRGCNPLLTLRLHLRGAAVPATRRGGRFITPTPYALGRWHVHAARTGLPAAATPTDMCTGTQSHGCIPRPDAAIP